MGAHASPLHGWMDATPDHCLTLRCGAHTATVAPAAGGRLLNWRTAWPHETRDWLIPIQAKGWPAPAWPKGGLFPLVPFSNRIRDAALHWNGAVWPLEAIPGEAHALHGQGLIMPWDVADQGTEYVSLSLDHPRNAAGWPWAWRARQHIQLSHSGLTVELSLCNRDATPMPAGMGLHPYFGARQIRLHASTEWAHEQEIAVAPGANTQTAWSRSASSWTAYLSGWDGTAELDWDTGPGLRLTAAAPMNQIVLHCNAGRYLCAEPVTHVCDAFNLAASGMAGTGMRVLAPDETLTVRLEMAPRPRPDPDTD